MEFIDSIQLLQTVISQVQAAGSCRAPNPIEFTLILALVSGIGIFSVLSGAAIYGMATTIVTMIISGASISAIMAAIAGDVTATDGLLALVATMVAAIKSILGC